MERSKLASGVVLVLIVVWIAAATVTFVDGLLFDADWRTITILTVGTVFFALFVYMGLGQPWRRWQRTPYW